MKRVEDLTISDLEAHAVWEYLDDMRTREVMVRPEEARSASLQNKIVGTQVQLACGRLVWALIGNANTQDSKLNELFIGLSLERDGKWFHLARYFDVDYATHGPNELAEFLDLNVNDVFPIQYDIKQWATGNVEWLRGSILSEPRERLKRGEIMALAVPKPPARFDS
jgi:hypothetical protein